MKLEDRQEVLCIEGQRSGYSPTQIYPTMTVGELIDLLADYDEDTPVMLRNDKGYTFGEINHSTIQSFEYDEDSDSLDGDDFDDEW